MNSRGEWFDGDLFIGEVMKEGLWRAANYVANTSLGRVALVSQLAFLNRFLEKPLEPHQISSDQEVLLADLCFNAKALNEWIPFSPLLVSSLWVKRASFTYLSLNLLLEDVVLVLKWNPDLKESKDDVKGENEADAKGYVKGLKEMFSHNFDIESYLQASSNDLMARFVNIILHKISLDVKNISIAIETPTVDRKIDILLFSTPKISLSKSAHLSLSSAANLSSSSLREALIQKTMCFEGPSRLELFSLPDSHLIPQFLLSNPISPPSLPAIDIANGPILFNLQLTIHPTLDIACHILLPPILSSLLPSHLFSLSNLLNHYKTTIHIASDPPPTPTSIILDSTSPLPLPSPSIPSPHPHSRTSSHTITFEAKADSDSDEYIEFEEFDEIDSDSPPTTILESHIPSPTTLLRFQLDSPSISIIYVPESTQEDSPFISLSSFLDPSSTTRDHYIHMTINDFSFDTSPHQQSVSCGVSIDEVFKIRPSERPYIPKCSDSMLPKSGILVQRILSAKSLSDSTIQGLKIQNSEKKGLSVHLGPTTITLPLGLPKLCSLAMSDIFRAFPSNNPLAKSETNELLSNSPQPSNPPIMPHEIPEGGNGPSIDDKKDLLKESVRLGESILLENGSSTLTSFNIALLVINLEIPLQQDISFSLPLKRHERMVVEAHNIIFNLHLIEAARSSAHAYRTLSGSFSHLNISMEKGFNSTQDEKNLNDEKSHFLSSSPSSSIPSHRNLVPILSLEGRSANDLDMIPENVRLEWRDKPAPSTVMSPEDVRYAPFSVPTGEMGEAKKAMSAQAFQNFSSSPCALSIALTVHMTTLNLSPGLYTFIMDVYDEYSRLYATEEEEKEISLKFSPSFVDFRSKFALLHLHVGSDPVSSFKGAEDICEGDERRKSHFTGNFDPGELRGDEIYDVEMEHVRLLQSSRYGGEKKSVLAVEVGMVEMNPKIIAMRLIGLEHVPRVSYAQVMEEKKLKDKVRGEEVNEYVMEVRETGFQFDGFSDLFNDGFEGEEEEEAKEGSSSSFLSSSSLVRGLKKGAWWNRIISVFNRIPSPWYGVPYLYEDPEMNEKEGEGRRRMLTVNICNSSFSISLPDESNPIDVFPQLVIIPHHGHLSIDLSTWLYHIFIDFSQILLSLLPVPSKGISKPSQPQNNLTTVKDYWIAKGQDYAGQLGTTTVTSVDSEGFSQSSLKCSLQIDTTSSQLVALELLYDSFLLFQSSLHSNSTKGDTIKIKEKISQNLDFLPSHPPLDTLDTASSSSLRPQTRQLPSQSHEPRVFLEKNDSNNLNAKITSWDYIPPNQPKIPLKLRFTLLPIDFVWKLRGDPINEAQKDTGSVSLHFSQLEARYDLDENDSSHFEIMFKGLDGFTSLSGDRGMHFFGFDPNGGHFRRMLMSFTMDTWSPDWERLKGDVRSWEVKASRFASFRLIVLPMQLTCTFQTFPFVHEYYERYSSLYYECKPHLSDLESPSLISSLFDVIAASLSLSSSINVVASGENEKEGDLSEGEGNESGNWRRRKEEKKRAVEKVDGTFFRRYFVSDLHLRLNLVGVVEEAKVRLPSVSGENVFGGFEGVALELRDAYAPRWQTALSSVIGAFPGLKLARTVTQGLYAMVLVPLEESRHGRSITYGFVKTLGSTVWDTATETIALTAQAAGVAYAGLGAVGKIFDRRSLQSIASSSQHPHIPSPTHIQSGASQSLQSLADGVQAASDNISGPIQRFRAPDGSLWLLVQDLPLALPGSLIYPISGAFKSASMLLQGTAAQMRSNHTTIHTTAPHHPPPPQDQNSEFNSDSDQ